MNDPKCFDDVLLEPQFSFVASRQDVDTSSDFLGLHLSLPVTNSNMDTVASAALSKVLADYGTVSSIHRFCTIEENIELFKSSIHNGIKPIVSIGVGKKEELRAFKLFVNGADIFLLDVAHAANIKIVEAYNNFVKNIPDAKFIVGNFGTGLEVHEFMKRVSRIPDAICVGIGGGSMCTTRIVTGVGIPTLASIMDCAEALNEYELPIKMMVNGGFRNSGDIVKGLAAGADLIMLGSMFAGTDEASGRTSGEGCRKEYRGSAAATSYEAQGKVASWRAPEGESTWVPAKGPAINVLNQINGGLRSAMSYLNAFTLDSLRANARFISVTGNTVRENGAHGK